VAPQELRIDVTLVCGQSFRCVCWTLLQVCWTLIQVCWSVLDTPSHVCWTLLLRDDRRDARMRPVVPVRLLACARHFSSVLATRSQVCWPLVLKCVGHLSSVLDTPPSVLDLVPVASRSGAAQDVHDFCTITLNNSVLKPPTLNQKPATINQKSSTRNQKPYQL